MAAEEDREKGRGHRQRKPSSMEIMFVLERFMESGTAFNNKLTISVHLEDESNLVCTYAHNEVCVHLHIGTGTI